MTNQTPTTETPARETCFECGDALSADPTQAYLARYRSDESVKAWFCWYCWAIGKDSSDGRGKAFDPEWKMVAEQCPNCFRIDPVVYYKAGHSTIYRCDVCSAIYGKAHTEVVRSEVHSGDWCRCAWQDPSTQRFWDITYVDAAGYKRQHSHGWFCTVCKGIRQTG